MKRKQDIMDELNEQSNPLCDGETPQDRRGRSRFAGTSLIWAVCLVGASFLLKKELVPTGAASWILATVPTLAAILLLFNFRNFLQTTDEFQRRIQLEALALGFGGSFFVFTGYQIFQLAGAPVADLANIVVVMPLLYIVGILLGRRRYR
jgi:drug/metabolite transporter (DMT)-like permease